ncbi:MAG: tetratricopeptide repeat protein [Betaproteobacteria bacterium]|nr:MAG: tetratricopeptide repeat protein [Betaproteobacteria bacterium]
MSLLLEALKKAERDKLGEKEQTTLVQDNEVVKDTIAASVSNYSSGEALELVPEKTSSSYDVPHQQTDRAATHDRIAAQNIFSAKKERIGGIRVGRASKWVIVSGVVLITIMSGAYYVWQETTYTSEIAPQSDKFKLDPVRQRSGVSQTPSQAKASVLPESNLAMAPVSQASISRGTENGANTENGAKVSAPLPEKDVSGADIIKTSPPLSLVITAQSSVLSDSQKRETLQDRAWTNSFSTEHPISIQHKPSTNKVSPQLTVAYQAYVAGDLDVAKQHYLKHLESNSSNKDVLLGLAAIATRMRQDKEAQTYYLRLLELDPRDPSAIAGMVGLGQIADPNQTESRLKTLLAQQPNAAALHFAIGNNYIIQLRWAAAQQSFFRALSIDSTNADYAFNLAVSLDHLNKIKLAAKYYSKALVLAGDTPVGFEKAQASDRLKELSR